MPISPGAWKVMEKVVQIIGGIVFQNSKQPPPPPNPESKKEQLRDSLSKKKRDLLKREEILSLSKHRYNTLLSHKPDPTTEGWMKAMKRRRDGIAGLEFKIIRIRGEIRILEEELESHTI